jgi:hypothetical protein
MATAGPLALLLMVHKSAIANLPPEPYRRVTVRRLTSVHPTMCSVSRPYELLPVRDMLETYASRLALAWLKLGGQWESQRRLSSVGSLAGVVPVGPLHCAMARCSQHSSR